MLDKIDLSKIPTEMPEVLQRVLSGQVPSAQEFLDQHLAALGTTEAAVLLLVGALFLIYGWQTFRLLVIANGAFFGGLAGAWLANNYVGKDMALFGLLAGGILLAVMVVPLIRYVAALGGGLLGSYAGYHAWPHFIEAVGHPELLEYGWVGGLIGLVVLGMLFFLIFRQVVMVITAVEGAFMAVSGAVALCLQHASFADRVREALIAHPFLLPLVLTVPSVVGFALQYNASRQSSSSASDSGSGEKKKKKAA